MQPISTTICQREYPSRQDWSHFQEISARAKTSCPRLLFGSAVSANFFWPTPRLCGAIEGCAMRRACRTAVDNDLTALHVRGIVRGKEQHGSRDLFGFTEAAKWDAPCDPVLQRGKIVRRRRKGRPDGSPGSTWCHLVDADTAR